MTKPIYLLKKEQNVYVAGTIKNLKIYNRKSDEQELAYFTLEDETGIINASCFVESYKKYKHLIKNNKKIVANANCVEDTAELRLIIKNAIGI